MVRGLRERVEGREGRRGEERSAEEREEGSFQTRFPALSLEADTAFLPELGSFLPLPSCPTQLCFPSEQKPVPKGLLSPA